MTQIFQVAAAEAPQLVDHTNAALYGWTLGLSVLAIFLGLGAIFYCIFTGRLKKWPAIISTIVILLLVVVGINYGSRGIDSMRDSTRANISQAIESKYGVKVLDPKQVYHLSDLNSTQDTVTHSAIPATDPEGKRIQITIELAENGTDVIAFSSGAEIPKIKG
jgi:MFS superfamily sulfate permease-like transporter